MSEQEMAYVALLPDCRCVVMAAVILDPPCKDTAKWVAWHIKNGDIVERVTVEQARSMKWATHDHAVGKAGCS